MTFLSAAEIAKRWNLSARSVRNYCEQGRIPGAFRTGKTWNIPETATKPPRSNARCTATPPLLKRLREEKAAKTKGGIYHKTQVELAYNSNRIEGSKLSLDQTRLIFETATITAPNVPARVDDIIETRNHFRAFDFILDVAEKPITEVLVKELHRILKTATSDASLDWFAIGDYKKLPNEVGGRSTTPPEQVADHMRSLFQSYAQVERPAFEDLVAFHVAFERIHPFQDGNGRVGRLLLFKECLAHDIVPFIIANDMKAFYYRGLAQWDEETGYLIDTCRAAQDAFKRALDYFRIPYSD